VEALDEYASRVLTDDDMTPTLDVDLVIDPNEITLELVEELGNLAPYGNANPEPMIALGAMKINSSRLTSSGDHLQVRASSASGTTISLIGYRKSEWQPNLEVASLAEFAGRLQVNHYMGRSSVQMIVEAYRQPADPHLN